MEKQYHQNENRSWLCLHKWKIWKLAHIQRWNKSPKNEIILDSCLDPIQALNKVTWPFSQVHSFTNIYCCFSFPGAKHRSQAGSDVQCKQNAVLSYISYLQVLEDIRPYSFYWRNVFICLLNNLLNEHIVFKSWMPIIFSYAYNCLLSWIGQRLIILKLCDHDLCIHNW